MVTAASSSPSYIASTPPEMTVVPADGDTVGVVIEPASVFTTDKEVGL
jgi:hypothetical protein